MDKESATEMMLRMSPVLALVNYASILLIIYFLVVAYREGDWADGATAFVYILFARFGLVALLRWRARKKLESISNEQ
jgi:hypothetical protein